MSSLVFCVAITGRDRFSETAGIFGAGNTPFSLVSLGRGTASNERLDMLGMDDHERAIMLSVMTEDIWHSVKRSLQRDFNIDAPGGGIAFTVPLSSVGGKTSLRILTKDSGFVKGDEEELKNTEHELIIAVCEQGYSEMVMDAAKKADAGGGTIIRARGTGVHSSEKFLGISLAGEKDMIFIVCKTEKKNDIMTSVIKEAGPDSRAKAIVFSLPVTDTAGLRLIEAQED
ncbi:MAG: P-II family nitrogen regulator [Clostridia bacterium]|nr:P-II family nitrogen regulator [Clostridia bacterium]